MNELFLDGAGRGIVLAVTLAALASVLGWFAFNRDRSYAWLAVGLLAAAASAILFAAYTLLSEKAEGAYGPEGAMFRAFFVASIFWSRVLSVA